MGRSKNEIATNTKKAKLIEAMMFNMGNISKSCEQVGISRRTYYDWMRDDAEFAKEINEVPEMVLDWVESELYKRIKEGNPACTIFFLKTKGKNRGYIEKVEQDITIKQNEVFEIGGKKIEF